MKHTSAEILREYGPFPEVDAVHGVSFDGQRVWFASGDRLNSLDPQSGEIVGAIDVAAHAAMAGIRGSPGLRGRSGSASTAAARSIRSIRKPGPCCAPSNPIGSSRVSPG